MDDRWERVGKNEALFRTVNESLREVGASFSLVAEHANFVCECGEITCTEGVELTLSEYERIRAEPTWFFIRPGHVAPPYETVIEQHDGYDIVAKDPGPPGDLAEQSDPRSS